MKPKVHGADKGREGRETEKPGHLMSLNDPKWRYLLISSINFSCKISLARLSRAYQPSDFGAENRRTRQESYQPSSKRVHASCQLGAHRNFANSLYSFPTYLSKHINTQ